MIAHGRQASFFVGEMLPYIYLHSESDTSRVRSGLWPICSSTPLLIHSNPPRFSKSSGSFHAGLGGLGRELSGGFIADEGR